MQATMAPLRPDSFETLAMRTSEKKMMENTSGGPTSRTTRAMGPMSNRVKMSDKKSPIVEE